MRSPGFLFPPFGLSFGMGIGRISFQTCLDHTLGSSFGVAPVPQQRSSPLSPSSTMAPKESRRPQRTAASRRADAEAAAQKAVLAKYDEEMRLAFEGSTRKALEEDELLTAKLRASEADALARRIKAAEAPAQASPPPPPPSVGPSLDPPPPPPSVGSSLDPPAPPVPREPRPTAAEAVGIDMTPFFLTLKCARERLRDGKPRRDTPGDQEMVDLGKAPAVDWSRVPRTLPTTLLQCRFLRSKRLSRWARPAEILRTRKTKLIHLSGIMQTLWN